MTLSVTLNVAVVKELEPLCKPGYYPHAEAAESGVLVRIVREATDPADVVDLIGGMEVVDRFTVGMDQSAGSYADRKTWSNVGN